MTELEIPYELEQKLFVWLKLGAQDGNSYKKLLEAVPKIKEY